MTNWLKVQMGITAVIAVLLVSGCSSSGGGGGDDPPESGTQPTGGGTTEATVSLDFYLGSLHAVNPANPGTSIPVESGATLAGSERVFTFGKYDTTTQTLSDLHTRAVVYAKDGKLWRVTTSSGSSGLTAALTDNVTLYGPIQLTSATDFQKICAADIATDFADLVKSMYVVATPGTDNACGTNDDLYRFATLLMTETDAAKPAKKPVAPLHDLSTGMLAGWLARENNELQHCHPDFTGCTLVQPLASTSVNLQAVPGLWPKRTLLRIGADLKIYDHQSSTLSAPLYTGSASGSWRFTADISQVFFINDQHIGRISRADGVYAPVHTADADSYMLPDLFRLTTNRVVFSATNLKTTTIELRAVDKSGAAEYTPLVSVPIATGFLQLFDAYGSNVFYNTEYFSTPSPPSAGMIAEDKSAGFTIPGVRWVGRSYDTLGNLPRQDRLYATTGLTDPYGLGSSAHLRSYDASNGTEVADLGAIPADIETLDEFRALRNQGLVIFYDTVNYNGEVFSIDGNKANSLVRVTNTPDIDESDLAWQWGTSSLIGF